ncbi:MAG: hypothetical protein JO247_15675 [Chloroflexi bacterium]|nr:hypothetical protein [Chloroflexota bacterium]
MRLRLISVLGLATALLAPVAIHAATPADACDYITGFQMLYLAAPQAVGQCTDQGHYLDPGADPHDFVQHTTGGLLVRRGFNDEAAFTNGYMSWLLDPTTGQIVTRLNTDPEFAWEKAPASHPAGVPVNSSVAPCIARDMNLAHCLPAPPSGVTLPGPLSAL